MAVRVGTIFVVVVICYIVCPAAAAVGFMERYIGRRNVRRRFIMSRCAWIIVANRTAKTCRVPSVRAGVVGISRAGRPVIGAGAMTGVTAAWCKGVFFRNICANCRSGACALAVFMAIQTYTRRIGWMSFCRRIYRIHRSRIVSEVIGSGMAGLAYSDALFAVVYYQVCAVIGYGNILPGSGIYYYVFY